jgi:AraC-like DNA-binding protein
MDFFTIITLLGIIQSLFYGIILFTIDRNNKKANRLLAILLILIGSSITPILFSGIPRPPAAGFLFRFFPDVRFLFGPFLYFYARVLANRNFRFQRTCLFHFIPYALNGIFTTSFQLYSFPTWVVGRAIFTFLCYAHVLVYSCLIIFSVNTLVAALKKSFSSIKNKTLTWLKYVLAYFIAVFIFMAVLESLHYLGIEGNIVGLRDELTALLVTIFIFSIGFLGLRQPDIFSGSGDSEEAKYGGSSLTPQMCESFFGQLLDYIKREKPYLDSELTIEKLAVQCGIPDYHLSRVINEKSGMIFYDFINSFRIQEAQQLLSNPENDKFTILGLAYDAGFNSKSAFYASFKKFLKMTPNQYKESRVES